MAVKRVFGRVGGVEVVLNKTVGDRWNVPVPFDVDGEYVVEIIAEDDAGNQAYMAKMLFVVNTALLCVHVIPVPFYGILQDDIYNTEVLTEKYYGSIAADIFDVSVCTENYYAEIIEPVCSLAEGRI